MVNSALTSGVDLKRTMSLNGLGNNWLCVDFSFKVSPKKNHANMKFNPLKLAAKYPTPATPKYSFSTPPKEGPKMKPNPNAAPMIPKALVLFSCGTTSLIYACATLKFAAPKPFMSLVTKSSHKTVAFAKRM